MSLRNQGTKGTDVMYTPRHAVETLLDHCLAPRLFRQDVETWECAAGAGHIARVLKSHGHHVLATDVKPPRKQVYPVTLLDFLKSSGPSGHRLNIITNPPYGAQSRLAVDFIEHALLLMKLRRGSIAMLLPFEFDASLARQRLLSNNEWFLGKITVGRRIRWVNLPQKKHGPMGHHAWFIWSNAEPKFRNAVPFMVTA
jgi:hypothetical protein